MAPKDYMSTIDFVSWPDLQKSKKAAKEYKFKLDKFQQKAVECLNQDQSVLVAAHTSAGKTAVAEYAIAKALKNN